MANNDLIRYSGLLKGNYRKGIENLRHILSAKVTADEFVSSPGVCVLFGLKVEGAQYIHDRNSEQLLQLLSDFGRYDEALLTYFALCSGAAQQDYDYIFSTAACTDRIVNTPTAMVAIVDSNTFIEKAATSEAFMTSAASSAMALSVIASRHPSRYAVIHSDFWNVISETDRSVTRYLLALAGRDTEECMNISDLSLSEVAMTAIAATETAMEVILASIIAMKAIAESPFALRAIALSAKARETFEASLYFVSEIQEKDSPIAMYVAACAELNPEVYTSLAILSTNSTAMATIAANSIAMTVLIKSTTAFSATVLNAMAVAAMLKEDVAKDVLIAHNDLLQEQRLAIYNTVKNDSTYFSSYKSWSNYDTVSSANATGAKYIGFGIPGSYGSASESRQTTMFHGHNGAQVIQRYGSYTDENYIYVGLGGATYTEQGDGEVRACVYQLKS